MTPPQTPARNAPRFALPWLLLAWLLTAWLLTAAPAARAQSAAGSATVSGTVTLQSWQGTGEPTPALTFTLVPAGSNPGPFVSVTQTPTPTAAPPCSTFTYALTGVPPGAYTLGVKGSLWLRENVSVDTTAGSVTGANVTLPPGDVNGDDVVDGNDSALLRAAFNTVSGGAGFNPNADLNGDGVVDGNDSALLRAHFNTVGASLPPYSLTLSPLAVAGGASATATLALGARAPAGGLAVSLNSDSAAASVPSGVTVPAGASRATFTVITGAVTAVSTAHIAASSGGFTATATLTINLATSGNGGGGSGDPGTGGGGSGGGSGPTPAAAFFPLPRPGTNPAADSGDTAYNDYDWTGLTQTVSGADGSYLQAQRYLGAYESWFDEEDLSDYNLGAEIEFTGSSTYKWLWKPPVGPTGLQNDPHKSATDPTQPFPEYPVYMLEVLIPYVEADVEPYYTRSDDTETGNVKDGFDPTWNPMFSGVGSPKDAPANSVDANNNFTGQLPRHFIKPATLETTTSTNDTVDAILSPYLDVFAKGDDYYGYAFAQVGEFASPIQMTSPTVLARPDLGDGQNQFVYSDAPFTDTDLNPAVLSVPAYIQALGTEQPEINWLLAPATGGPNPKNQDQALVGWTFDEHSAAANSLMAVQTADEYREDYTKISYPPDPAPAAMDLTIVPSTTDTMPVPNDNKNHHSINFHGLPETPDEYLQRLGNHTVTLNVSTYTPGQPTTAYDSAVAYFQAFFDGLGNNYPYGQGDANWWHYYTMMDPYYTWSPFQDPTEVPGGPYDPVTNPNPTILANYPDSSPSRASDPSDQVEIHNDAYGQQRMRVFDIDPNPVSSYPAGTFQGDANGNTLPGNFHVVRYVGYLELQGIYSYISTTSHELGHVISFNKQYTIPSLFPGSDPYTHAPFITLGQSAYGADTHAPYTNGFDDLWEEWKIEHHLNPYWSQTVSDQAYGKANPKTGRLTTGEIGISDPNASTPTRGDAPDNEILADLPAVAALFENDGRAHNFDAWNLDWADGGVNRADSFDSTYGAAPYFGARQFDGTPAAGKPPVFYLRFVPAVAGYPQDNTPAFEPNLGKLANGAYGIESLDQLREQYPNLVTSIDDLGLPDSHFHYNP